MREPSLIIVLSFIYKAIIHFLQVSKTTVPVAAVSNVFQQMRISDYAASPRLANQGTIFSEHEAVEDCCDFYPFDIFLKM